MQDELQMASIIYRLISVVFVEGICVFVGVVVCYKDIYRSDWFEEQGHEVSAYLKQKKRNQLVHKSSGFFYW